MFSILKKIDILHGVAIFTWLAVAASVLSIRAEAPFLDQVFTACLFVFFILAWLATTLISSHRHPIFLVSLLVQWCCVVGLFYLVPMIYVAILGVLWSSVLGYVLPMWRAMLMTLVAIYAPFILIYQNVWQHQGTWLSAGLFFTFNVFAVVMVNVSLRERDAKEQAQLLNNELIATQALLKQSATEQERTRIARNIHDLLGHHLTALSIKLQYASHTLEKDDTVKAKPAVDECLHIAKLLLSDVREAVSEMRDHYNLDFRNTLYQLCQNTPRLSIDLHVSDTLQIENVVTAQHVLRCIQECITNALKHSTSNTMSVRITSDEGELNITIEDTGTPNKSFKEGNGLTGIRERIELLKGSVAFHAKPRGFSTDIRLPGEVL